MTAKDPARFYHPELDGLRFLAFLGVFLLHCYPLMLPALPHPNPVVREVQAWVCSLPQSGVAGVDLFFVLSSFLITELLLREHERTGGIRVGAFYMRRLLRIWPLYFLFLTLVLFVEPRFTGGHGQAMGLTWPEAASFYGFVGNWYIALTGKELSSVAVILWTVSIEEQFYLFWPLLMKWLQPKRLVWVSLAMIVIAWLTRGWLIAHDADLLAIKANTFARLDSLACGSLLAIALRRWKFDLSAEARKWLFAAGALLFVATYRYLRIDPPFAYSELLTWPLWSLASALVLVAVYRPTAAPSLLASAPLVYLGRISYGLYVWHLACIGVLASCGLMRAGSLMIGFYALPLTIAVAAVSYELLEKPFLQWKKAFTAVPSQPVESLGAELVPAAQKQVA
jgi:peptidoglycan/LPS O-acetylase OafA/YrhL